MNKSEFGWIPMNFRFEPLNGDRLKLNWTPFSFSLNQRLLEFATFYQVDRSIRPETGQKSVEILVKRKTKNFSSKKIKREFLHSKTFPEGQILPRRLTASATSITFNSIILENDSASIVQRVVLKNDDLPIGEQTVAQVFQNAKEKFKWSLLRS